MLDNETPRRAMQSESPVFALERCRRRRGYPQDQAVETLPSRPPQPSVTSEREQHLRALADKLLFTVEKRRAHFTLSRTTDVSDPVRREGLTLEQAEELLTTWKLRGPHGG
jgi:hypothetical protein